MADIASIRLPGELTTTDLSSADGKKLKSYLYQLTEQLRYVLANLDDENMSSSYNAGTVRAVEIAQLTEQQRQSLDQLRRQIVSTANKIAHDYQSAIEQESDRLTAQVTELYTAQSATQRAELESLVDSRVTQTSRELSMAFSTVSQLTQTTAEALQQLQSDTRTWFRFGQDGLEIGKAEDGAALPYSLRMDNEKLSFLRYGVTVAYFQYNRLYVTAVEAADRVSIGGSAGEGFYDFVTTATGLGVKWRAS